MGRNLIMSITLCKLNYVKLKNCRVRVPLPAACAARRARPRPPQSSNSFCLTTDQEDRLNGPVGCLTVRNPIKRVLKKAKPF